MKRRSAHRHAGKSKTSTRKTVDGFSFVRSCMIAFALGLFSVIGFDALRSAEFEPVAEAAASIPLVKTWAIDTNGDGVADIANPVEGAMRGEDIYGAGAYGSTRDGGKRRHEGVDYVAAPGQTATAPIAGTVTRIGHAYRKDARLQYIEIDNAETGYSAKVLYVAPTVNVGDKLAAGDVIGTVQDLSVKYPAGITNHVHVEVRDPKGATLDASMILPQEPVMQAATQALPSPQGPS